RTSALARRFGVFVLMLAARFSPAVCPEPWRRARLVRARRRRFCGTGSDGDGRKKKKRKKNISKPLAR
ncbi:MAG: hypothetical protein LGL72_18685, partial [Acidibrevibacterium sp.]|nr:hypothetical protein [Acidibrevibacterium fodinaquatile]